MWLGGSSVFPKLSKLRDCGMYLFILHTILKLSYFFFSNDCSHFELEEPDFSLADEVRRDIERCAEIWTLYEEFYEGFQEKANEDWITFRSGFISVV